MVAGRWLSGRILALFVFREAVTIVAGAGGSANTSSQEWTNYPIEDLRKSECELLGRCEKDYPEQPVVAQPAAKPQTDVVPDEPEEDNEVRLKVKPGCNSLTTVKGIPACPGQEIFFDNFLNPQQKPDRKKWGYEIFMPFQPDYGFVVFDAQPANAFLRNGILNIKPTYAPDDKIRGTLTLPGCTGNTGGGYGNEAECSRVGENHNILPPILSARLTTRNTFTFKYGRVDIVAKLPLGDWIVPEIWLEPKKHAYGKKPFQSGRIQIAMARGNRKLQCDKKQYGNHLLETGIFVANVDSVAEKILQKKLTDEYWGDRFHNYSVLWTKDNIEFLVDGEKLGLVKTTNNHPLYHTLFISDVAAKDLKEGETDMAPFDKEFYISLGLSVGGHTVFPDYCKSDDVKKPWKNGESKAAGRFWQSKDTWQKTWSWRGAITNALQVESVKVTAL